MNDRDISHCRPFCISAYVHIVLIGTQAVPKVGAFCSTSLMWAYKYAYSLLWWSDYFCELFGVGAAFCEVGCSLDGLFVGGISTGFY